MKVHTLVLVVFAALLTACGSASAAGGDYGNLPGDPVVGKALFDEIVIGISPGCVSCHSVIEGEVLVGPSLHGIGTTARSRIPGYTAEEYLRESIMSVDAYIVEGFYAGYMYNGYAYDLDETQINDLISYMLTLE